MAVGFCLGWVSEITSCVERLRSFFPTAFITTEGNQKMVENGGLFLVSLSSHPKGDPQKYARPKRAVTQWRGPKIYLACACPFDSL